MDLKKTGAFIAELRRQKNMTQKELAGKLNVTDKAVSKWERGIGYPEVTTIPLLADLLDVSASEIILGERTDTVQSQDDFPGAEAADAILSDTVEYMERLQDQRAFRVKNIAFLSLSAAFLTAIFVCFLCNYVIDQRFDWSWYVFGSEATAWLIAAPFLKLRKNRFVAAAAGLTVSILPLLLLIEALCPVKDWVFPFALPIVLISLISLWVSILLFVSTRIGRLYLISFEFFLWGVVDNLLINGSVDSYLKVSSTVQENLPNAIVAISCGFIALVLLFAAVKNRNSKR